MQTKPIPNHYVPLPIAPLGEAVELDPDSAWAIWDMAVKLQDRQPEPGELKPKDSK